MWELKSLEHYAALPAEQRIDDMKHWMLEEISNLKALLRSVAGVLPEIDSESWEALSAMFDDLPLIMSDLEDHSVANFIVKYRLEHDIKTVDHQTECMILNQREMGPIITDLISCGVDGSNYEDVKNYQRYMDSLIQICTILGFEEELKDLKAWRLNLIM